MSAVPIARGQTISVQFLNGKTGKSIKKGTHVSAFLDGTSGRRLDLYTDRDGVVSFDDAGVLRYEVTAIGFIPCDVQPLGSHAPVYEVDETKNVGIVSDNGCSHSHNDKKIPGRLIIFVKPASWWQLLKN